MHAALFLFDRKNQGVKKVMFSDGYYAINLNNLCKNER